MFFKKYIKIIFFFIFLNLYLIRIKKFQFFFKELKTFKTKAKLIEENIWSSNWINEISVQLVENRLDHRVLIIN
jgi:hypothetical protein